MSTFGHGYNISGAINYSGTTSTTIYTTASDEYAIISVFVRGTPTTGAIRVGSLQIAEGSGGLVGIVQGRTVYVGPGTAIESDITGSGVTWVVIGTVFKNT